MAVCDRFRFPPFTIMWDARIYERRDYIFVYVKFRVCGQCPLTVPIIFEIEDFKNGRSPIGLLPLKNIVDAEGRREDSFVEIEAP